LILWIQVYRTFTTGQSLIVVGPLLRATLGNRPQKVGFLIGTLTVKTSNGVSKKIPGRVLRANNTLFSPRTLSGKSSKEINMLVRMLVAAMPIIAVLAYALIRTSPKWTAWIAKRAKELNSALEKSKKNLNKIK